MAARDWFGLAAGALLAGVGLGAWLTARPPTPPPAVPAAATTTISQIIEPGAEPAAAHLVSIPPSVGRVLESRGNLAVLSGADLSGSLPDSVREVLIGADAVLTIKGVVP